MLHFLNILHDFSPRLIWIGSAAKMFVAGVVGPLFLSFRASIVAADFPFPARPFLRGAKLNRPDEPFPRHVWRACAGESRRPFSLSQDALTKADRRRLGPPGLALQDIEMFQVEATGTA
jgi:hypothetical protein